MKYIFKNVLFLIVTIVTVSVLAPRVHAFVPDIDGYVKTRTGAPIPGVWVEWKDSLGYKRYAQTDSKGRFFFVSQTTTYYLDHNSSEWNKEYNTYIDIDLDGTVDTRQRQIPYDEWNAFGCYQNPHTFTVIKPKGWTGTFDNAAIDLVDFANVYKLLTIGIAYYDESVPANPTVKPSASIKPTSKPSSSPTASPFPTPTVLPKCTGTGCTKKSVGSPGSGAGSPFVSTSDALVVGTETWVQIVIEGRELDTSGKSVVVNEQLSELFSLVSPLQSGESFRLYVSTPSGSTNITSICNPISVCSFSQTSNAFTISLPEPKYGEKLHVQFKVVPQSTTASLPGGKGLVDSSSSTVKYSGQTPFSINNTNVVIKENTVPYFSTFGGGDIFSTLNILSTLPLGKYLSDSPAGVVSTGGTVDVGSSGEISKKEWKINGYVNQTPRVTYASLYEMYRSHIKTITPDELKLAGSGHYLIEGDLTITPSTIPAFGNRVLVVFVTGNVYVGADLNIPNRGNSSLAIISAKNIGVRPNLKDDKELEGVYIADGKIDTSCAAAFDGTGNCASTDSDNDSQLVAEGVFIANGFNLDRAKLDSTEPSEKFVYRPDLLFGLGELLGTVSYSWKEVIE